MPVPSQDHCGYHFSGGVIPILPYVLWTLICSVIVLYTLSVTALIIFILKQIWFQIKLFFNYEGGELSKSYQMIIDAATKKSYIIIFPSAIF